MCFEGTGDLAEDMQNQMKANSLRIEVLDRENAKLNKSVCKLVGASDAGRHGSAPVQLWNYNANNTYVFSSHVTHTAGSSQCRASAELTPQKSVTPHCFTDAFRFNYPISSNRSRVSNTSRGSDFICSNTSRVSNRSRVRSKGAG